MSIPVDAAPFAPGWRQTTCRRLSRGSEEGPLGALWVNHRAIGSRRFAFRNRGASTVPRRAANRWQNTGPAGQRLSPSPHKSLSGEPGTWAVNPPVRESAPGRRCPLSRVQDTKPRAYSWLEPFCAQSVPCPNCALAKVCLEPIYNYAPEQSCLQHQICDTCNYHLCAFHYNHRKGGICIWRIRASGESRSCGGPSTSVAVLGISPLGGARSCSSSRPRRPKSSAPMLSRYIASSAASLREPTCGSC